MHDFLHQTANFSGNPPFNRGFFGILSDASRFFRIFLFHGKKAVERRKKRRSAPPFSSFRFQLRQQSRERWAVSVREVRMDIAVCELHPLAAGQADDGREAERAVKMVTRAGRSAAGRLRSPRARGARSRTGRKRRTVPCRRARPRRRVRTRPARAPARRAARSS